MPRWNFKQRKRRGQAGLIALVVVGWLACLSIGVYQAHLLGGRSSGYRHGKRTKAMALGNGLAQAMIDHPLEGRGEDDLGPLSFSWQTRVHEGFWLDAQLTEIVFAERDSWPHMRGLRINGQRFHLVVTDYVEER